MAQVQDLGPIYRGEDASIVFTMTPLTDITAWTISFELKQSATDPAALLTQAATLTTPASGIFTVPLTAAQTATLAPNSYLYDVWRTDSGSAALLSVGRFTVKGSPRVP